MGNTERRETLTNAMIETICAAARKLTGAAKRQFQAEVAIQYCQSSARNAERIFGWGRRAVSTGLSEKRTGLRCADAFRLRGRKKSAVSVPQHGAEAGGNADFEIQANSTMSAIVAVAGLPVVQTGDGPVSIDPAPTADANRQPSELIVDRAGKSLRDALKDRRRDQ
jgi:hypothetical protein